jgi:hypothetical protein
VARIAAQRSIPERSVHDAPADGITEGCVDGNLIKPKMFVWMAMEFALNRP